MASSSTSRPEGVAGRIRNAASTLYSENQTLITDMRKAFNTMKEMAVDLERENQSEMLKQLEVAVVELLEAYEDCNCRSSTIQSVGNTYQPGTELTDFNKLLEDEFTKLKASSSSVPQNHPLIRQFHEAVWKVHHEGEPMPGEEQEDIVMTSTQGNVLNVTCPLTGKPVTELAEPVRSLDCKHIYEKNAVKMYMRAKNSVCPVAACPKILQPEKVVSDPTLLYDIEEMRSMSKQTARTDIIEDITVPLSEESE
ncbi:hypothetical protein SLEP1_g14518 [Rubroshorea leprosula]|uniref:SP-RING-type domain-containing protein n=1 Tax=Rubroshorea leprosula TaxID=152421 RepID=A0AAV5IJB6_9ROSI|nr:hypothetical protein SLEP1_g14518 [Rubroshorea leprosula]